MSKLHLVSPTLPDLLHLHLELVSLVARAAYLGANNRLESGGMVQTGPGFQSLHTQLTTSALAFPSSLGSSLLLSVWALKTFVSEVPDHSTRARHRDQP